MDKDEYLRPQEVADELRVDRQTVYRMIREGRLTASRVGKRGLRITRAQVQAMLRPVKPADLLEEVDGAQQ